MRPALAAGSVMAALVAVGACSSPDIEGSGPPPIPATGKLRDAGRETTEESRDTGATPPPPAPGAYTYRAEVTETPPVKFGGDPFCEYTITLKDIVLEVAALDSGEVVSATEQHDAVEKTVTSCSQPTIPINRHSYTLLRTKPDAGSTELEFSAGSSNKPKTSLVVELARSADGFVATATWKRIDIGPPLDWQVKLTMTLTRVD